MDATGPITTQRASHSGDPFSSGAPRDVVKTGVGQEVEYLDPGRNRGRRTPRAFRDKNGKYWILDETHNNVYRSPENMRISPEEAERLVKVDEEAAMRERGEPASAPKASAGSSSPVVGGQDAGWGNGVTETLQSLNHLLEGLSRIT